MPATACATTATAATFRPASHPAPATSPSPPTPSANASITSALGSVNPTHAASAPHAPARRNPTASPTWLLAGPGRNCASATTSAYASSVSHPRRPTNSARKYPRCATGPPNDVRPRRRNTRKTSSTAGRAGIPHRLRQGAPATLPA
jgi:hypothetical protein